LFLSITLYSQTNKIAGQITEHSIGPVAKEVAEKAAKELVEQAAISTGKQVASSTEAQLTKMIIAQGNDVVILSRRVPEATEVLARNAQKLLPLTEQLGDDILRVEARAPGYAEMAAKTFGKEDLPRLLKLSELEMKGVLVASSHTTEPLAPKLLLEGTEKGGMSFLEKVSGTQILAAGLSVAAIKAVMGIEEKIPPGIKTTKVLFNLVGKLLFPITIVAAVLLAAWGGLAIRRGHKRSSNVDRFNK